MRTSRQSRKSCQCFAYKVKSSSASQTFSHPGGSRPNFANVVFETYTHEHSVSNFFRVVQILKLSKHVDILAIASSRFPFPGSTNLFVPAGVRAVSSTRQHHHHCNEHTHAHFLFLDSFWIESVCGLHTSSFESCRDTSFPVWSCNSKGSPSYLGCPLTPLYL